MVNVLVVTSSGKIKKALNKREAFNEVFYALLHLIPSGKVTTYNSLGKLLGIHPRYVGLLLKNNERPIVIPCHRVVMSDGRLGGYSLAGRNSSNFKERLLKVEGVEVRNGKVIKNYIINDLLIS